MKLFVAGTAWRVPAVLFALIWLSCGWFGSWPFNANNATRLFAAIAIVETGRAEIDRFADKTIDKAQFAGHFYTDKAPGVTLMAVPFIALANAVTGETSAQALHDPARFDRFMTLRQRVAVLFGSALLTALAGLALFDLGTGMTGSRGAGLAAALGFALGTPIWGWSTTLFGHAPVAALLVIATWAIWRGTLPGFEQKRRFALIAGLALGWALVIEYTALLPAIPIGIWALWRTRDWRRPDRLRLYGIAAAAGVAALLPLLGYNLLAFGTPFRLGYSGVVGFDGMKQGLFGLTYPKPDVLTEILFGRRRGMLWVAPALMLLAPFGFHAMIRKPETRDIGVMAAAVALTAFLYNAAYFYWDGGNSIGPRHALPAAGFLAIGFAGLWARGLSFDRWAAGVLLAASIAVNLLVASTEIMGPAVFSNPLLEHNWRHLFLAGQLRTLPNEFWGWTSWSGLQLYLLLAAMLAGAMVLGWRRDRDAHVALSLKPSEPLAG